MEHSDNPSSPNPIKVSVVIPALNEADSIRGLLENLLNQTFKPQEIVITDGGSTDATIEIVEEFIASGAPVKLIRETRSMPGRARNVAAKAAACEWLAFTDGGITLAPDWLEALTTRLRETSADVIYGTYDPIVNSFFTECAAIAYVPPPFSSDDGPVRPRSIVSALMRRRAWETVGGFPEDLRSAEDLLFMNRVEAAGFRVARTSRARAFWQIQPDLRRTFRRFTEYSRNNIRAGLFAQWQRTIFIYYLLIAASIAVVFWLGVRGLIVPLFVWVALLIARAVKTLYRNRNYYPTSITRYVARLVYIAPIIATLDVAAFTGSLNWLWRDRLRLLGSK